MENKTYKGRMLESKDWILSLILGGVVTILFLIFATDNVPVGFERVVSSWVGLSSSGDALFPVAGSVANLTGMSKFYSPVFGGLCAVLLFFVVTSFIKESFGSQYPSPVRSTAGRIGGTAAVLVFLLTPCVFTAATRHGPAVFDAFLALFSIAVFVPSFSNNKILMALVPFISGVLIALGVADMMTILLLLPLCGALAWSHFSKRGIAGYIAVGIILLGFFVTSTILVSLSSWGFSDFVLSQKTIFKDELTSRNWFYAKIFALIPFVISLFSCPAVFKDRNSGSLVALLFHLFMSIVALIAIASPLSVSSVLGYSGYQPVLLASAAAVMAAYLMVYWWVLAVVPAGSAPSGTEKHSRKDLFKSAGYVCGIGFSLVLTISLMTNVFVQVDFSGRTSLDAIAKNIVSELGDRTWFVTDGVVDGNVELASLSLGKKINLISLKHENDDAYVRELAEKVLREKLGGEELSKELADILTRFDGIKRQRLVPFIEHWFKNDPDAAAKAAVWGAPQLCVKADMSAVPGLYFFVAKSEKGEAVVGDWVREWPNVKSQLTLSDGWGSYRSEIKGGGYYISKRERKVRNLRRHIGFMATSQGNYHHFNGLEHAAAGDRTRANECFEKAFALYSLVLDEIDPDNVVALFNIKLLADKNKFKKALLKNHEIEEQLKIIEKDPNRRYRPEHLMIMYGTICDPEFMMRYAQRLSRGGQHSQAVFQMRRAIDLIPADQRRLAEMNILVHYLTDGSEKEKKKAREICMNEIKSNPGNRNALVRLSHIEVLDGNIGEAVKYLDRALSGVENNPAYSKLLAQRHLLKGEFRDAEIVLRKAIDHNSGDVQAWALLTHVLVQSIDKMGDPSVNADVAVRKNQIIKEIEEIILPQMESRAKDNPAADAVYRSTRAFVLMRKGGYAHTREARDSFDAVANSGHGSAHTGDMILTLDMQLNDKAHAEDRAMRILASNPDDSLANYIMGSISLHRGENNQAEKYLRKSVVGKKIAVLAYNDLAEVLRRLKKFEEAEKFARKAVEVTPQLYVAWETLGSVLMDVGKSFEEAEKCIKKACELSKDEHGGAADVRMLISLARVQIKSGQLRHAKGTMRTVQGRMDELTDYEKAEFEELMKSVK